MQNIILVKNLDSMYEPFEAKVSHVIISQRNDINSYLFKTLNIFIFLFFIIAPFRVSHFILIEGEAFSYCWFKIGEP